MYNNNISNTTFSSKIYFVSGKKFKTLISSKGTKKVIESDALENISKINSSAFTTGIITCLAGVAKNTSEMFHFFSENAANPENLEKIINWFGNITPSTSSQGFLIGGRDIDEPSVNLFKAINSKIKNSYTIFFGQKDDNDALKRAHLFYDKKNDSLFINLQEEFLGKFKNILTPKKIKNYFAYIYIHKGDEVYANGKRFNLN